MRWIRYIAFVAAVAGTAAADPDPHAEMAIALAAQAELVPPPAVLPVLAHASTHAQTAVTKPHGLARASEASERAADQAAEQAHMQQPAATSLAHQAQAASMAAAGQAQAAAAKDRASHPHTTPRR